MSIKDNKNNDKFSIELEILRKINKNPNSSQRNLANQLGYSLGKLNYCLKAMKKKGLINILKLYPKNIVNINDKDNPKHFGIKYLCTKGAAISGIIEEVKSPMSIGKLNSI